MRDDKTTSPTRIYFSEIILGLGLLVVSCLMVLGFVALSVANFIMVCATGYLIGLLLDRMLGRRSIGIGLDGSLVKIQSE